MSRVRNVAALTLGLGLVLTGPSAGLATAGPEIMTKHSSTVVEIDAPPGTIVLEEVGPWRVKGGRTVVTDRRIALTPATRLVLAERRVDPPSGFPGDFVESTLEPWAWGLRPGDFVTIDCVHEESRLIAHKITVVDMDPR